MLPKKELSREIQEVSYVIEMFLKFLEYSKFLDRCRDKEHGADTR